MNNTTLRNRKPLAVAMGLTLVMTLSACGGGGGGPAEPPRFETTTVGGVAAVKDNTTGITWARQLGDSGFGSQPFRYPTLGELATVAELSVGDRSTYFNFLPTSAFKLFRTISMPATQTAVTWAIDLGTGDDSGQVELAQIASTPDYVSWFVLQPNFTNYPTSSFNSTSGAPGVVTSSKGLQWKICTESTPGSDRYNSISQFCEGAATAMTYADAQTYFGAGQIYRQLSNWRLPTRDELVELLQLEAPVNAGGINKLPAIIRAADPVGDVAVYWTSSPSKDGLQRWQVDFSNGTAGGVALTTNLDSDVAYVRLVRK